MNPKPGTKLRMYLTTRANPDIRIDTGCDYTVQDMSKPIKVELGYIAPYTPPLATDTMFMR